MFEPMALERRALDLNSRDLRNFYGCAIHVGVGVGAGDVEVNIIYITFMIRAQYTGFTWYCTRLAYYNNRTYVHST